MDQTIQSISEILAYFILYSFFGWVMESIFKTIVSKKIVNSGFLHGPFCPIYGIGALIMLLFLERFQDQYLSLFIVATIILTVWEYLVGLLLEWVFHIKYWDYSEHKFNFQGRICLSHSIIWGILGTVFIVFIHPFISQMLLKIPIEILTYCVLIIGVSMLVDCIVTIIKIKNIKLRMITLKQIGNSIKEKTDELKILLEQSESKEKSKQILNNVIEELKQKQEEIKEKLEKQTRRFKKAFPTMKLKGLGEAINQRIKKLKGEK